MTTSPDPLQPSREHRPRLGRSDSRLASTAYGLSALLVGLPVTLLGAYYALAGFGYAPFFEKISEIALRMLGWIGITFALAGFSLTLHGTRGILARRRAKRLREHHPRAPWVLDRAWDPSGIDDEALSRCLMPLLYSALLASFLIPFNWVAFFSGDAPRIFQFLAVFFDLIAGYGLVVAIYRFARYLKFGFSRLSFPQFPLALGERVRVGFSPPRFRRLDLRLVCYEEWFETVTDAQGRKSAMPRSTTLYQHAWSIESKSRERETRIEFDLPADTALSTQLVDTPRIRYWELEVTRAQPGIDFSTVFLLPVYSCAPSQRIARPGAPRRSYGLFALPYAFELGLPIALCASIALAWLFAPEPIEQAGRSARGTFDQVRLGMLLRPLPEFDGRDALQVLDAGPGGLWVLGKSQLLHATPDGIREELHSRTLREQFPRLPVFSRVYLRDDPTHHEAEVWLGTWYGELLRRPAGSSTWEILSRRDAPLGGRIHAIAEHRGRLYLATRHGVWEYDPEIAPEFAPEFALKQVAGLPAEAWAKALQIDAEGRLYAALGKELWQLDGEHWRLWWHTPDGSSISTLHFGEADHDLLIGSNNGLFRLDRNGKLQSHELAGERLAHLARHPHGQIWAGSLNKGLFVQHKDGHWLQFSTDHGLPSPHVSGIAFDAAGNAWLTLYGGGLFRAPAHALSDAALPLSNAPPE